MFSMSKFRRAIFRRIEPTGFWTLVLRWKQWRSLSPADLSRAVELWAQNAYATLKALDDAE